MMIVPEDRRFDRDAIHPIFPMKFSYFHAFFYCVNFKKHHMFSTTKR